MEHNKLLKHKRLQNIFDSRKLSEQFESLNVSANSISQVIYKLLCVFPSIENYAVPTSMILICILWEKYCVKDSQVEQV